jgi:5-methylcytosine-specific restriction endonuclease McrA
MRRLNSLKRRARKQYRKLLLSKYKKKIESKNKIELKQENQIKPCKIKQITNYCLSCDREFESDSKQKFCSIECESNYNNALPTEEDRILAREKSRWKHVSSLNSRIKHVKLKFKIPLKDYLRLTEKCAICGYTEIVVLHHITHKSDGGKNELNNYIGLCSNCHDTHHLIGKSLEYLKEKYGRTYK